MTRNLVPSEGGPCNDKTLADTPESRARMLWWRGLVELDPATYLHLDILVGNLVDFSDSIMNELLVYMHDIWVRSI